MAQSLTSFKLPQVVQPSTREVNRVRGLMIDAGMSERGWSHYSRVQVCERKLFLNRERKPETTQAGLIRGSIGHLLQAHHRVIEGFDEDSEDDDITILCGANPNDIKSLSLEHLALDTETLCLRDASVLSDPETALDQWIERNPNGRPFRNEMMRVFNAWKARPDPIARNTQTIAVETQIILDLGINTKNGEFGLFVRPNAIARHLATIELPEYEPVCVDAPGTIDHGNPIYVTRRMDHIVSKGSGRIIVDHKHTVAVDPKDANGKYAIDGGFQIFQIIGQRLWGGNFLGNQLNLISTREYRVEIPMVTHAPGAMSTMPLTIQRLANRRSYLESLYAEGKASAMDMDNKMNETGPCAGMKYGKCVFFHCCLTNNANAPLTFNQDD